MNTGQNNVENPGINDRHRLCVPLHPENNLAAPVCHIKKKVNFIPVQPKYPHTVQTGRFIVLDVVRFCTLEYITVHFSTLLYILAYLCTLRCIVLHYSALLYTLLLLCTFTTLLLSKYTILLYTIFGVIQMYTVQCKL